MSALEALPFHGIARYSLQIDVYLPNQKVTGSATITTQSSENGATSLSRMNFSGYVGHVTIFS